MQFISVKSSTITQIGLLENTKMSLGSQSLNILRIIFTSGNIFDYYGVDKKVFDEFIKAESVGKFFHANIKDKYQYEKISNNIRR